MLKEGREQDTWVPGVIPLTLLHGPCPRTRVLASLSNSSTAHLEYPSEDPRITGPHSDLPYWVYQSFLWTSIFLICNKVRMDPKSCPHCHHFPATNHWSSVNPMEAPAPTLTMTTLWAPSKSLARVP